MAREILFRAKRIDDGEWVEGFLFSTSEHTYIAYQNQFDDDLFLSAKEIFIEVDPETVFQYTDLTDKSGRKIFEGDCLGHKENVVEYLCGGFVVSGDRPLFMMAKYNEVVGNIFDKE